MYTLNTKYLNNWSICDLYWFYGLAVFIQLFSSTVLSLNGPDRSSILDYQCVYYKNISEQKLFNPPSHEAFDLMFQILSTILLVTQIGYITGLLYNRVFSHENNKPLHWRKPGIIFEVLIWKIISVTLPSNCWSHNSPIFLENLQSPV